MRMRGTFVMNGSLVASMKLRVFNSEVLLEKSLMLLTNFRESRSPGRRRLQGHDEASRRGTMRVALRVVGELLLLGSVVLRSLFERVVREVVDVVQGGSSWQTWFASLELSTTLAPVKPWEWLAGNRGRLVPRFTRETACCVIP
jgi:hypothetical protein